MRRRCPVAVLAVLIMSPAARAGSVWTLDGKTYEGEVTLSSTAATVTPPRQAPVTVPLQYVLQATLRDPDPAAAENPMPQAFRGSDVGAAEKPGKGAFVARTFRLTGAGTGLSGKADAFFYVWHTLHGTSDFRARVVDVSGAPGKTGAAGLTLRAAMAPAAPHATVLVDSAGKTTFAYRAEYGGDTTTVPGPAVAAPCYLRLSRQGTTVTAEASRSGADWQKIGAAELKEDRSSDPVGRGLRYTAFAGLLVASGAADATGTASFDHVLSREPAAHPDKPRYGSDTDAPAQWSAAPLEQTGKGVLLKSGTYLAGAAVGSLENAEVTFTHAGAAHKVKTDAVAQLVFQQVTPDALAGVPAAKGGLLLYSGDFVEGRFRGVENGQVKISSVIFGIQKFDLAQHAMAVVIGAPAPDPAHLRLQLRDGSVIMTKTLAQDGDALLADEPALGRVRVPLATVYRVQAPAARATLLTFAKPEKTNLPPGFNPVAASANDPVLGGWAVLKGVTADSALALATPSDVTFALDAKAPTAALVCRVGVPARSAAGVAVRVRVLVDDAEAGATRAALRSTDAPETLHIALPAGAKRLTFRAEASGDPAATGFVVIGDALLIR